MSLLRRDAIRLLGGTGTAVLGLRPVAAVPQAKRELNIELLGFALGIHVPAMAAVFEGIPSMPGYGPPKTVRIDQIRTLTSNLVAGSAHIAEDGPTGIFGADEQGSDVKIIGLLYRNTDLVFVVNTDKVKTYKDLEKPENVVAVNGKGDITEVMLLGPLIKNGVDISKVPIVEIGGSGGRMRALLSGRVAAVPIHFDQAAKVEAQGPYKVLFQPWEFYKVWINEVWAATGSWLKDKANARAAIDVIKATTLAFRRANRDFNWYLDMYRKYVTLPNAKDATEKTIRPLWSKLSTEVKAWPDQNVVTAADFKDLIPLYKAAGDITGSLRIDQIVDTRYAEQAMKELGRQGL
jgi:NitT/TauT family transport system substrate-binding protein